MVNARSEYKRTWNDLSDTRKRAVFHVQGDAGEDELNAAGKTTVDNLSATVGINLSDVVLEIGCGVGRVGKVLAPLCKEWIGCDVAPNMLAHAQERLKDLPDVRLIEISGFDLKPVADELVDMVYSTVVFMHLDEWDRYNYVLEAMRVLRPGGRLFVDNFNLCHEIGWQVFEVHRTSFTPEQRPSHISKSSTPMEIETYLTRAGFQSVQMRETDGWI